MANVNKDRFLGAWWAAFTGDALAMPCRGYTDTALIKDEYGDVREMLQPKSPHIESNISIIKIPDLGEKFDYIGKKAYKAVHRENAEKNDGGVMCHGCHSQKIFYSLYYIAAQRTSVRKVRCERR